LPKASIPLRRSARLRGQEPGASPEVPILTVQSGRLRGQEPGVSIEVVGSLDFSDFSPGSPLI